jgi:trimeric autotransporter adhesin
MARRTIRSCLGLLLAIVWMVGLSFAGSQYRGQVTFGDLQVPGATITAKHDGQTFSTVTDSRGVYVFPDLAAGMWTVTVEMQGFATVSQTVNVEPNSEPTMWQLKLLPLDQIKVQIANRPSGRTNSAVESLTNRQATPQGTSAQSTAASASPASEEQANASPSTGRAASQDSLSELASNGFLINGSVDNGAASPFAQFPMFGNHRPGSGGLYNGGIGIIFGNSALDARPFSLTGQNTPKASYNLLTGLATLGGPLKIPHLVRNGPDFFVAYEWTRSHTQTTASALVPDSAERTGDFSHELDPQGQPVQIFDPATGQQFPNNMIPPGEISAPAQALLSLYPPPNFSGNSQYNYQVPILSDMHQDALLSRFDKTLSFSNQVYGGFAFLSTRSGDPNLFGFLDTSDVLGMNAWMNWSHRIRPGVFMNLGYRFSRLSTRLTPYWADRENISGSAGITGNAQDAMNWGPPALMFSSGLAELSDGDSSFDRNETNAVSFSMFWNRGLHNFEFGGDFRRQEFNYLSQQNPRGTLTFTGAATAGTIDGVTAGGDDFADFLLGIPDASAIAFGNADKYFRESVYDAYFTDDWRLRPEFTLDAGVRWEYGAPITELFGRLVNLDVTPGFTAVAPVVANNPVGPLTGTRYPSSLINPYKGAIEPRVGIAWRPISGSSLIVRAGYGIYYDTSVYQTIALEMAQQEPLSKSLAVQNSAACPLTLASPFNPCSAIVADTFGIDPAFRPGYSQDWHLELQRDLPGSLQLTVSYLGTKGTHGAQEFLPNTFPPGAANPCPMCPSGFAYMVSGGNSTREAGQVELRRRLRAGLTATVEYTFAKAIDDDSLLGGQGASGSQPNGPPSNGLTFGTVSAATTASTPTIAQNWLDLAAERGLSTFDQRHLLTAQLQYTTGMGARGGTLLSGWKGSLFKEWTFLTQVAVGSGLPETPVYGLVPVPGTGVTGTIRPDVTGAPLYAAPPGLHLNPAAFAAPAAGQWGNAGRNSVIGPSEFNLDASMVRTFRVERYYLDFGITATNVLNHVTFTTWDTTVNSVQFGLPVAANAMRSMQTTLRLRF